MVQDRLDTARVKGWEENEAKVFKESEPGIFLDTEIYRFQ
jgi:hypothetical protein